MLSCKRGELGSSAPMALGICVGVAFVWFVFSSILGYIQYNHGKSRHDNIQALEKDRMESLKRRMPRKLYEGKVRKYKVNY